MRVLFLYLQVQQTKSLPNNTRNLTLSITRSGTGSGTVISFPAGVNCGNDCSEIYGDGTIVTLTATPTAGSTFVGWSGGDCSGTGPCSLALSTDTTVTATFSQNLTPPPIPNARLSNISTRAFVGTGDDVLIGGFIIDGNTPKTVVVRALGRSLQNRGVQGSLSDPILELFRGQTSIAFNDDCTSSSPVAIPNAYQPADNLESALVVTLEPGAYTAIVEGLNGATGIALIEVFDLD